MVLPWVTDLGVSWAQLPLAGQVTSQHPAPTWRLSHSWHHGRFFLPVTMSLHTHGHLFLAAARCQAWAGSTLCHVPHMPKGALGAWAGSKGTAGTQPWELPALAMRCWQPCATHPQAQGGVAWSPSGLRLLLGRRGSHGHHSAPFCAPWLWGGHGGTSGEAYALPSSQHSASASPVSVAHGDLPL